MKFAFSNRLFQSSLVFLSVSSHNQFVSAVSNLRGINPQSDSTSHRILEQDTVGTFLIADIQYDDGSADNRALQDRPEQTFNVELSDGTIFELDNLPPGFTVRGFVSGHSSITLPAGTQLLANGKADMKGKAPQVLAEIFGDRRDLEASPVASEEQDRAIAELHRRLAVRDGTKTVLAVRVNASNDSTTPSEAFVSNSVFGNGVDSVNLASQYSACSHNKLNFVKANSKTGSYANISNGVVTVNLPSVSTSDGDGVMRNAITNELFNIFGTSASNLADHVMYCLPPNTMSGIAYAYINSWNSVYSDYWCTYVSAQMHEIGHNLNFAHSNEAGTYKDQTGMMGYSYSSSDTSMCFNGAKSWQTGWYTDKEVTVNSAGGSANTCFQGDLYGIVDYPTATTVLLQVRDDVNSYDYYVNFNAQKGFNSGTREAGNQVTVTRRSQSSVRDSYAESELVAKLSAGGSFFFGNYNINVGPIDTSLGKAQVTVLPTGQTVCPSSSPAPTNAPTSAPTNPPTVAPTNAPTSIPTNMPTKGPTNAPTLAPTPAPVPPTNPPTSAPTNAPTLAPTPAPVPPTNPPTSAPTNAPTLVPTNAPTNAPTPSPTPNPTACDCSLFGGGGECKNGCGGTCIWDKGSCLTAGSPPAPTNAPTPAPTPNPTVAGPPTTPTPTNAPTSSPTRNPTLCDCTQFGGGGECKSGCGGTCNWVKGSCLP